MRRVTIIGLACVAAMALAGNARAEDKVTFKKAYVPGSYKSTLVFLKEGKTKAGENELASKTEVTMAMAWKVAAPDKDGTTALTLQFKRFALSFTVSGQTQAYDSDKPDANTMPPGSNMAEMFGKLVKAVITATVAQDGKVKDVTGLDSMWDELAKANPDVSMQAGFMKKQIGDAMIRGMIEKLVSVAPDKPVGVGEEWSIELPVEIPVAGKITVKSTYTLKALEDGNKTAVIDAKGRSASQPENPNAPAPKVTMDVTGSMKVAVDNPLLISGESTTRQKLETPQLTADVTEKTTIKIEKAE